MDGAGLTPRGTPETRSRQDTADRHSGSPDRRPGQGSDPQRPSPTRTWRGREINGSTEVLRPRSIPAPQSLPSRPVDPDASAGVICRKARARDPCDHCSTPTLLFSPPSRRWGRQRWRRQHNAQTQMRPAMSSLWRRQPRQSAMAAWSHRSTPRFCRPVSKAQALAVRASTPSRRPSRSIPKGDLSGSAPPSPRPILPEAW